MADGDQPTLNLCTVTVISGVPSEEVLAEENAALPVQFQAIRKYIKKFVQIYITYDRILVGILESVGASLDFVLSHCSDVPNQGAVRFLGVVRVSGQHLKFIAPLAYPTNPEFQ